MGKNRKLIIQYLAAISLVLLFFAGNAQEAKRPKVAVVLSGGGAKGFAHIGVLKVLEEEGIPVDIIVGTSMGSIVGGLYSIGYSADDIAKMSLSEDWAKLFADYIPRIQLDQHSRENQQRYVFNIPVSDERKPIVPNGLINGQNVLNLFCGLAANVPVDADFSKFPISFACIGTDLETGKEVILNSGFLPTAIFGSMAIPAVFAPIEHNGHLLVDGGLVNNFPTDVAKMMGADIIIGSDIRNNLYPGSEIVTINKLMDQLINFYTIDKDSVNKSLCNVIIHPNIEGFSTSSFYTAAVDTLIRRGLVAATSSIDDIRALKGKYNLQPRSISSELTEPKAWRITNLTVTGSYVMPDKLLKNNLDLETPGVYSLSEIKRNINNLYGTGHFKRAYFKMEGNENDKTLGIVLDEQKAWDLNVGMRLNTRSIVSVLINSTRKDYTKTFSLVSATADVSSNPRLSLLGEIDKNRLPKIALMAEGQYAEPTIYLNRDYSYPAEIYIYSFKFYTYQKVFSNSTIGVGTKYERYIGKMYNVVSDSNVSVRSSKKNFLHYYGYWGFDNLDDYYFPSKGTEMYSELDFSQDVSFSKINPTFLFKMRNTIRFNSSLAGLLNLYGRSVLTKTSSGYLGNYLSSQDYEIYFDQQLPFYGLPTIWSVERSAFIGMVGLQANIYKKHYLSLMGNYLLHNSELHHFSEYQDIWGGGFTYSFRSVVGPFEATVAYSDEYKKLIFSANIGFWF